MRVRRAAIGGAALLIVLLGTGSTLALQPNTNPGGLDGVEEGSSRTFDLTDGARVHVLSPQSGGTPDGRAAAAAASVNGIVYHGGPIVPAEKAVAIYWSASTIYSGGPAAGTTGSAAGDGSLVGYFLGNLGGSPHYNINTTYTDTVGGGHTVANNLSYTGFWADSANAPSGTQNVSDAAIQSEIVSGFTSGKTVYDPSTVYAVFSAGSVNLGGGAFTQYCAYHGYFPWNGHTVLYAVMPYNYASPSACSALSGSPNGDFGADAEVNTLAHELEEANTDPQLNAWYDSTGYENADKCAWNFGSTHTSGGGQANITVGGKGFLVQQNWLNANGGLCAQTYSTTSATVPGAPTLNSATAGVNSVSLSWSVPASNGGSAITAYKVYRGTTHGGESATPIATLGNVSNFTDAAATAGSTYFYTVAAANALGTGTPSNELSATPLATATAPGAPTLNGATAKVGSVSLSWSAPASNGGSAITAYQINRTSSGNPVTYATSTPTTSFTDTSVTAGTTYTYTVSAINGAGTGVPSNQLSATPPLASVPGAPVLTAATSSFRRGVQLNWTVPTSVGSAISSYVIYRRTSTTTETLYATRSPSSISYRDSGTTSGTVYYYWVIAVNASGPGPHSNEASASAR
jgi:fibronectin type 3 domain-containing protein